MKQTAGIYLMFAGILMGVYLLFGVYLPSQVPMAAPRPIGAQMSIQQPLTDNGSAPSAPVLLPENAATQVLVQLEPHGIVPNAPAAGPSAQVDPSAVLTGPAAPATPQVNNDILLASVKYRNPEREMHQKAAAGQFGVPEGLKTEVEFWKKIYSTYTSDQAVLHDPENLGKVYKVISLPHCGDPPTKECMKSREDAIKSAKSELMEKLDPSGTKDIVMRAQVGQRDKFLSGIVSSERYLAEIESVFKEYGIPLEITRLPFVESMFNNKAYSRSGAAGIWQLMRGTAKVLGLKVGKGIDERYDPAKATNAAAKHLKRDFNRLGKWELAINAYNVGPSRIADAVRQLGTQNIVRIINNYQHSAYGFAARNFYPCFLAALSVYENRQMYFKELYPLAAESASAKAGPAGASSVKGKEVN